MAKKDLRAQMDAARAAAAYIGAAQEDLAAPERGISPSGSSARSSEKDGAKAAPRRSRTHEVEVAGAAGTAEIAGAAGTTETADAAAAAVEDADAPSRAAGASRAAARTRKPRKKSVEAEPPVQAGEGTSGRMTAQVRVPMTAEQREHADLLASVMKITRAEVMRQALDEYWESHKSDLQAAVAACEALTKSS